MTAGEPPTGLAHRPIPNAGDAILPEGSWDCHFHIIDPRASLVTPRSYTPVPASLAEWQGMAERLGIACGVIVQPSVYGRDNSVLLSALREAPEQLRGVVVVGPDVLDRELESMGRLGVRGVRVNLRNLGGLPLADVPTIAARVAPLGWHVQFQIGPDQIEDVDAILADSAVPSVIDHCAFIDVQDPERRDQGLRSLRRHLDRPGRYVKVSAPYRLERAESHDGFANLATELAKSHPDRLLWATDWPHTEMFDFMPADIELAERAMEWFTDAKIRKLIFVDTPLAVYGMRPLRSLS